MERDDKTATLSGRPPEIPFGPAPGPVDEKTGMHSDYWILSEEERSKGFVRPIRFAYKHLACKTETTMNRAIAETYARDPKFYSATFCIFCRAHFLVGESGEFVWEDGSKVGS